MLKFFRNFFIFTFIFIFNLSNSYGDTANVDFKNWLNEFKASSQERGISKKTLDIAFKNVKYIEKVIV